MKPRPAVWPVASRSGGNALCRVARKICDRIKLLTAAFRALEDVADDVGDLG